MIIDRNKQSNILLNILYMKVAIYFLTLLLSFAIENYSKVVHYLPIESAIQFLTHFENCIVIRYFYNHSVHVEL